MAAGRRTVVAGGRSSGINEEGGAGEVKKRGNGGGAAAMPMPCTPEKPRVRKEKGRRIADEMTGLGNRGPAHFPPRPVTSHQNHADVPAWPGV